MLLHEAFLRLVIIISQIIIIIINKLKQEFLFLTFATYHERKYNWKYAKPVNITVRWHRSTSIGLLKMLNVFNI